MNFTDVDTVRTYSGLDDETNIPSNVIRDKIDLAVGMLKGAVCDRYVFPMKYHRARKITLSGASTATANFVITVNSTAYTVAVTDGDTAEEIADEMRDQMKDNDDFITDNVGSGAEILLISITDSDDLTTADAEINASETTPIAGITTVISVRQDRYPSVIRVTATELATALLLSDSYGVEAEDTQKSPSSRLEAADEIIARIQGTGEDDKFIKIKDEITDEEMENSTGDAPRFYPTDASTADTDADTTTAPRASINDVF